MFIEELHDAKGILIRYQDNGQEVGHAFLYLLHNNAHTEPFGLMEDVLIYEDFRGKGYGKKLVEEVIRIAKREGCYKLIGTSRYSRPRVHEFYIKLGFEDYGKEFRMNL